jgi:bacterioferritin
LGYGKTYGAIEKRAIEEIKHAKELIVGILFLDGLSIVSELNRMSIGANAEVQFTSDWQAERDAIQEYNTDIRPAVEYGDNGTRKLLEAILTDEEAHIDWIEA